ncbi:aminopeptidase [Psychroflexus planctonicus]|uniref:Aminopeptidase n=2 Tax=Psychroflexus planctonicus TaxID=1526575 RepID=A0ABQ1SMC4_9FLAO|nr:aminopeptidase [Psychroflexus planctonicus]
MAQEEEEKQQGHTNENKFKQLHDLFATPNSYRTAAGAPGHEYYQNTADYQMNIVLDDKTQRLTGEATVTYTNNSPNELEYLWMQLDQNIREKGSPAKEKDGAGFSPVMPVENFTETYMGEEFDGGFKITSLTKDGQPLPHKINWTMMRIDMPQSLKPGESFTFDIEWNYLINNHVTNRARSGYEHFEEDGNNAYVIAQFFPRMAVYNDVEGWQNYQFWGNGEFALPFGNYDVKITVPEDHVMEATGELQNRKKVFTKDMMKRYDEAKKSFDKPVLIVTQEEAEAAEKAFATKTKTWEWKAEKVRDFGFATSRKFIYDAMNVKIGDKEVMAISLYPKEGNPLWEEWSTYAVASTLETYSDFTFQYPYHKAISVHAKNQGMEYPMICWNYGRPNKDGTYSDRVKYGMISVIIHEIGHNYFPMIVNSDERQWGWMDEGLNTFMQYLAEQEFGKKHPDALGGLDAYPSRRGEPSKIVDYMKGNQDYISPIMTNPEQVYQLGNNAYGKPATALNILRETVMGPELFDYAFKTFAQRWMFKHPTPEDFFRTMDDASAVDLDWYFRGWFYTTDYVDIGVKSVKEYLPTNTPTKKGKELLARYGITDPENDPRTAGAVYVVEVGSEDFDEAMLEKDPLENAPLLNEFIMDNFSAQEQVDLDVPKYFYEVTFNKPGGLVMPIIVEYAYEDGSTEKVTYPAQVWRKNDKEVSKAITSDKRIVNITVDPDIETADVDLSNNNWPAKEKESEFDEFKNKED